MKGGIRWYYDSLTPRAAALVPLMSEALEEVLERLAQQVEDYAKQNARWEDRTGAARDGLTAEVDDRGLFEKAIVLYHTAEHGIWLEVRWNGEYAIIQPTIEAMGPVVMAELSGMFALMG